MVMRDVHGLAGVDLNLLVALDALLTERHVTRAANRLGLTQPAASHALARLRTLLGDTLLVRGAAGRLEPTPRAEALAPVVRRALAELAQAVRGPDAFDPAAAQRRFVIGSADYAQLVLLPGLAARLSRIAPGVDLTITHIPPGAPAAMAAAELDLALGPPRPEWATALRGSHLFDEQYVCLVRGGHPAAPRRLTLARYCQLDHLLIAPRGTPGSMVDDALAALGHRRRVAVSVPHFLVAPHVVAATDLIVTCPARMALHFAGPLGLVTLAPPVPLRGFPVHQHWHERTHHDPAHRWLREQIAAVAAALPPHGHSARKAPPGSSATRGATSSSMVARRGT